MVSGRRIVPLTRDEAAELVRRHHRHHPNVSGHRFAIGLQIADELVGAAIVGRPSAPALDEQFTAEVTRLVVVDGTLNGCSQLYGASRRVWFAMGGRRLITYTLPEEGGHSLRASGARFVGEAGGGSWSRRARPRVDKHPLGTKWLWEWRRP